MKQRSTEFRGRGVGVASELCRGASAGPPSFGLEGLAGHLVELSAGASTSVLTMCALLFRQAQEQGEPGAWVATGPGLFFPPDFAASGIDLEALPIIRVDKGLQAAQAAEILLRSGSFGLLVLDLGEQANFSLALQTRLRSLARRHRSVVVLLTRRQQLGPSLGPLISQQLECRRERIAAARYRCSVWVHKDKLVAAGDFGQGQGTARSGRRHVELCRGPDGLY